MSNNLARKVRRKSINKVKKERGKQIKRQVALFRLLPDNCASCAAEFDKTSKEAHMTWQVKVDEQKELVYLFCPQCQAGSDDA